MHWCLYDPICGRNCDTDCPYKDDMCKCCVSVNYRDCKGCKYNKKGSEKDESQKSQTDQAERYQAKHMDICRRRKRVDKAAVLRR